MQTAELDSTQEDTERMINILNSTYAKEYLKQEADNATFLDAEERALLLN